MNKDELNKTLFKDAKKWWVEETDGNSITIRSRSPLGEDFATKLYVKSIDDIPNVIQKYADDFDTEKHARHWYNKRGKRNTPLYDLGMFREDARDIKYMLLDLAQEVNETYKRDFKKSNLKPVKMKQVKMTNAKLGKMSRGL